LEQIIIRAATAADAPAIHALVAAHQAEGHLLPRDRADIEAHLAHFVVGQVDGALKGCAELAPLSAKLAEVRSLVVAPDARGGGVASALVEDLAHRAKARGFESLCALAHDARFFVHRNFSIVPHLRLPEKIAKDCVRCPLFRRCGQHAMLLPLNLVGRTAADVYRHAAVA
jgi:amino-acid N-acetyltransferase